VTGEDKLYDVMTNYLREVDALGEDEVLTAWVISFAGEIPGEPNASRSGMAQPKGQRYYVSHGLAAMLMASFNAGMGPPQTDDDA
jgi:hypothetical protein